MADEVTILIALATYNEIENLPELVDAIRTQLPNADVLVVDDNSPDGTPAWCETMGHQNTWFSSIIRPEKMGLGSALMRAMQESVARKYDYLITMDSDWSHPPEYLPAMVDASSHADVVVGSRYCPGGGIDKWAWHRRLASKLVNFAARCLLGVPVSDCSGNYRMYRTEQLAKLQWENLQATGYSFLEEVLCHLARQGATFAEVPIVFAERRAGESKISLREAVFVGLTMLRMGWRRLPFVGKG
jgi:dolichol-phosphate mannosyltransferase